MPPPLPNLAISSRIMIKLDKKYAMGRNLYNVASIFYDIIVILILWRRKNATAEKVEGFRGGLLNISKRVQLIFTKLVIFRQSHSILWNSKIEDRSFFVTMVSNSWVSAGLKIMIEEKWHFPMISNWHCIFQLRFQSRSPKLQLTTNFSLIHQKTRKTMKTSPFISYHHMKMTIMTSYFQI